MNESLFPFYKRFSVLILNRTWFQRRRSIYHRRRYKSVRYG